MAYKRADVTDAMREAYKRGEYDPFPTPPVCTAYWREDDWVFYAHREAEHRKQGIGRYGIGKRRNAHH